MGFNNVPLYIARLSCKHTMMYSPIPFAGDTLWCDRCKDYRVCMSVSRAWRMECLTCELSHQYGADEGRIRRTAVRHLRLNPDHDVWIKYGDASEQVGGERQESLPICDL
jgi:hypothetical protein